MAYNTGAPGVGHVQHTIDGGVTWERLATPANLGLNSVRAIDTTHALAVGEEDAGGFGIILHVAPA
jgi:photosystem II stability/assembly factor-like uncharacterized protein